MTPIYRSTVPQPEHPRILCNELHILRVTTAARSCPSLLLLHQQPVIPAQLSQRLDASPTCKDEERERERPRVEEYPNPKPIPNPNVNTYRYSFSYPLSEYGQEFVMMVLSLLLLVDQMCPAHLAFPRPEKDRKTLHTKLVDSYALGLLAYTIFESPAVVCLWVSILETESRGLEIGYRSDLWRLESRQRCDNSSVPYASEFESKRTVSVNLKTGNVSNVRKQYCYISFKFLGVSWSFP